MKATSKIRILWVIDSLSRGGAEQALVNLLPKLQERGYHCSVAALRAPYALADPLERRGVQVHKLDVGWRWNVGQSVARLAVLVRRERPHIVHSHLLMATVSAALTKPFAPAVKRVVTFENMDYVLYPANTRLKKLAWTLHRSVTRGWMDRATAISSGVRAHYEEQFGLKEISVIPHAIVLPEAAECDRLDRLHLLHEYGFSKHDFVLAMVGRLVVQKGHGLLLDALSILKAKGQRPKVLVIGQGPLREFITARIAELGLEEQVALVPACEHARVIALLRVVDAFVMPSVEEGLGLAAAEAMAVGLPVIATRVNGLLDLLEDEVSGLFVPPGDPASFSTAISRVMTDADLRRRLGAGARARIDDHFTLERLIPRWDACYRNLLSTAEAH